MSISFISSLQQLGSVAYKIKKVGKSGYRTYKAIRSTPIVEVTKKIWQRGFTAYKIKKIHNDTQGRINKLEKLSGEEMLAEEAGINRNRHLIMANAISYMDALRSVRYVKPLVHLAPTASLLADYSLLASSGLMATAAYIDLKASSSVQTPEVLAWEKKKKRLMLAQHILGAAFVATTLIAPQMSPEMKINTVNTSLRNTYYATMAVTSSIMVWENRKQIADMANMVLQKLREKSAHALDILISG